MTTAAALRAAADACDAFTIGVEEEYLLVGVEDPHLVEAGSAVAALAGDHPSFRQELPPCQVEMATPPRSSVVDLEDDLRAGRAAMAGWCAGSARAISAAVHPHDATFASVTTERGAALVERFGWLARSQVLGALQVHVAVGSATNTIAVHDELRAYLPHLAALAAAAPFHRGHDRGMASERPLIAGLLPRQGTPPALGSWESFADDLRWGVDVGALDDPTQWWWELRPHPLHGTLEVRVADAQPSVEASMGVVELIGALVRWLAARAETGSLPTPAPSWRIDENRWAAASRGVAATFADVRTGERRTAAEEIRALLDVLDPWAERGLDRTRALVASPSHERIRAWGLTGAVDGLAREFLH